MEICFNLMNWVWARIKSENYKLMTMRGKSFLPSVVDTSIEFIREIIRDERKVKHKWV